MASSSSSASSSSKVVYTELSSLLPSSIYKKFTEDVEQHTASTRIGHAVKETFAQLKPFVKDYKLNDDGSYALSLSQPVSIEITQGPYKNHRVNFSGVIRGKFEKGKITFKPDSVGVTQIVSTYFGLGSPREKPVGSLKSIKTHGMYDTIKITGKSGELFYKQNFNTKDFVNKTAEGAPKIVSSK